MYYLIVMTSSVIFAQGQSSTLRQKGELGFEHLFFLSQV